MVPSLDWFLYAFVRKEAVLSSQIEGTQATLVDLLSFEAQDGDSSQRVHHRARTWRRSATTSRRSPSRGRRARGVPGGCRSRCGLLNEAHRRLMRGVRGADKQPGEVRRSQNWIGGTRP